MTTCLSTFSLAGQCISKADGHSLVWGRIFKRLLDQGRKEGRLFESNKTLTQSHITEIKELNAVQTWSKTLTTITVTFPITNQRQHNCPSKLWFWLSVICNAEAFHQDTVECFEKTKGHCSPPAQTMASISARLQKLTQLGLLTSPLNKTDAWLAFVTTHSKTLSL